jgi:hypothetical protein
MRATLNGITNLNRNASSRLNSNVRRIDRRLSVAGAKILSVLEDVVDTVKTFAKIFEDSTGDVKRGITYGTVFFIMWLFIYLASFCIREESLTKGVVAAYAHSWLSVTSSNTTSIHSELALEIGERRDAVTRRILYDILHKATGAARVRLALIHNGVATINGIDLLRYDMTESVATPGHNPGDAAVNEPLSNWSPDLLPSINSHECALNHVPEIQNLVRREKLLELGADYALGCPVVDVNNQIFGAVIISWDAGTVPPTGESLRNITDAVKLDGERLGAALDMSHDQE